jgi:hypothetical protein
MGGGDLNLKKEWHPATFKNQEDVWKREQAVLAEQRKTQQLQKEKEEERLREEIEKAMPGGRKKMRQKLDWMYSMGAQNNSTSHIDEDKEAFLLGKKKITQIENEPKTDPNAPKVSIINYSDLQTRIDLKMKRLPFMVEVLIHLKIYKQKYEMIRYWHLNARNKHR